MAVFIAYTSIAKFRTKGRSSVDIMSGSAKIWHFHRWTKWEQYEWRGFKLEHARDPLQMSQRRQKRHCEVCGKEQDELVRNG